MRLEFRPSRWLAALVGCLHLLALLALLASLSPPALVVAAAGVLLSGAVLVAGPLRRPYGGVYALKMEGAAAANSVTWRDSAGSWHEATLGRNGYVSPWLIVLSLDGGRRPLHVVLGPDSADAEALRILRVWLRGRAVARAENDLAPH